MPQSTNLNIRISIELKSLIDNASSVLNETITDFVREALEKKAKNTLLDQNHFSLSEPKWKKFIEILDSPTKNPRLDDLMSRKPVWD